MGEALLEMMGAGGGSRCSVPSRGAGTGGGRQGDGEVLAGDACSCTGLLQKGLGGFSASFSPFLSLCPAPCAAELQRPQVPVARLRLVLRARSTPWGGSRRGHTSSLSVFSLLCLAWFWVFPFSRVAPHSFAAQKNPAAMASLINPLLINPLPCYC